MNRRLVTVLVAILLGLIGTVAVLFYVKSADDRAVAGKRATMVLVAGKNIPAGTPVSDLVAGGYLKAEQFPASSVPSDAVGSVTQLPSDSVVRDNLPTGDLLRSTVIVPRGSTSAFAVPDGKIAVSVQLADPARVAGFVKPGSKVVVFATGATDKAKDAGTRTLLIDVEVLSVGSSGSAAGGTGGSLVTLAVTQQEAERLIFSAGGTAGAGGGLYLGLEGGSSNLSPTSPGVTALTLFGG